MVLLFFIFIPLVGMLGLLIYQAIQSDNPTYQLQQLERESEEIYGKVVASIEYDIQERYMKRYNASYLRSIQKKHKEFIALQEKYKDKPEEQIGLYRDWLNFLLKIYPDDNSYTSEANYSDYAFRSHWPHGC